MAPVGCSGWQGEKTSKTIFVPKELKSQKNNSILHGFLKFFFTGNYPLFFPKNVWHLKTMLKCSEFLILGRREGVKKAKKIS